MAWSSTNADQVIINPPGEPKSTKPPDNAETISGIDRDTVFTATASGAKCSGKTTSEVYINIYTDQIDNTISQSATYRSGTPYWSASLPDYTYDQSGQVEAVIIDSRTGYIDYPTWHLDHIPGAGHQGQPTGMEIRAMNNWTTTPASFPVPGEYQFTLEGGEATLEDLQRLDLSFRLRIRCSGS